MSDTNEIVEKTSPEDMVSILNLWAICPLRTEAIKSGLINCTYKVRTTDEKLVVLQRVNRRFSSDVTDKISKLTPHLESCGLKTPHVVVSKAGRTIEKYKASDWRLLTFVEGVTYEKVHNIFQAGEAGKYLAKFHLALTKYFDEEIESGDSVHDFSRHLENLRRGLEIHRGHRFYSETNKIARSIFSIKDDLPLLSSYKKKLVHGDPKISNFLFSQSSGKAECLLDLDTVGWMGLPWELGDAFRSWCNPIGEDNTDGRFDVNLFRSAYGSYIEEAGDFLTDVERKDLVLATLYIYLELSARFALDVLEERYFSWDTLRFSSAAEHNLVRSKGQLSAGGDLLDQLGDLSVLTR